MEGICSERVGRKALEEVHVSGVASAGLSSLHAGRTALHIMAEKGQLEAVKLLRDSGKFSAASVRISSSNDSRTALDIAKGRRDTEMIALLEAWTCEGYDSLLLCSTGIRLE